MKRVERSEEGVGLSEHETGLQSGKKGSQVYKWKISRGITC